MNRYRESSYRHFQSAENLNRLSSVENQLYRPSPAWSSQLSLTGQQEGRVEVVRDVVGQVQLRQLCKPTKSKVGETHSHTQSLLHTVVSSLVPCYLSREEIIQTICFYNCWLSNVLGLFVPM